MGLVKAYFSAQPWTDGRNADDFLRDATDTPTSAAKLRICVAWAKRGGLLQIAPYLHRVREAGGYLQLVTGLSAGGATKQGLEEALLLFNDVYVVFDVRGPTFHPKVYLYRDGDIGKLLVGSHNLTSGGLFRNVEAGLELAGGPEASAIFDSVEDWIDALIDDYAMTARLDAQLLAELTANPGFRIADETVRAGSSGGAPGNAEFGPFSKSTRKRRYSRGPATTVPSDEAAYEPADEETAISYVWSKELSRSEALRPNPGSNPTAVLRLGKANWDIDKMTFFREDFFGNLAWSLEDEERAKYVCTVDFDCVVDGVNEGNHTLTVDFMAARVANQNNVPTVLHWGTLSPAIRDADHIGSWVVLKALANDRFSLEVKAEPDQSEMPQR
jgi:HKD family nuclease